MRIYDDYYTEKHDQIEKMPLAHSSRAADFKNPAEKTNIEKRELLAQSVIDWTGEEHVEYLSNFFMEFM